MEMHQYTRRLRSGHFPAVSGFVMTVKVIGAFPTLFQCYPKSIPTLSQMCSNSIPTMYQTYPKPIPTPFQQCTKLIPNLYQHYPKIIPNIFQ